MCVSLDIAKARWKGAMRLDAQGVWCRLEVASNRSLLARKSRFSVAPWRNVPGRNVRAEWQPKVTMFSSFLTRITRLTVSRLGRSLSKMPNETVSRWQQVY